MPMCYLVSKRVYSEVGGELLVNYEPLIVFHFMYQAEDWVEMQDVEYKFDISEIECEGL